MKEEDDEVVVPFQAGSPMIVAGPTNSGKTHWVNRLLMHDMFTEPVASILYCYGVYQKFYNQMRQNADIKGKLEFMEGLPGKSVIDSMNDGQFHIIVLDDLMEDIVKSVDMMQLFTKYCHHMNITAIFISQNAYYQGQFSKTISLNQHVMVLFENKRDQSQLHTLSRQTFPGQSKKVIQAVQDIHENYGPYSYTVLDCTPGIPKSLQIRTRIFPGETCIVYSIS